MPQVPLLPRWRVGAGKRAPQRTINPDRRQLFRSRSINIAGRDGSGAFLQHIGALGHGSIRPRPVPPVWSKGGPGPSYRGRDAGTIGPRM